MASCPVRAEQVLESHGRPLRITLSRPSDCAKYEITLDVALHFGPEDHSCAEKLNKNNDQVGREPLQLFKSGQSTGEGRSAAQSSGGLRAVANRPGSSAAALCRRPPGQPRHTGCCEPTRIECCCALSKAARSAASHGLLRTD